MRNKKSPDDEKSLELKAIEHKVDLMMDPKIDETEAAKPIPASPGLTTAPELPKKLQKELAVEIPHEKPAAPEQSIVPVAAAAVPIAPLSIDKLDAVSAEVEETPAARKSEEVADNIDEPASTNLDDNELDKAVDDIAEHESDTVLAIEDAKAARNQAVVSKSSFSQKLGRLFRSKRLWLFVCIVIVVIFALPQTRYTILGMFIKKSVTIQVLDSKTASPVSNAKVAIAGTTGKTDGNGKAKLSAPLGQSNLVISKQYYLTSTTKYFIGFKSSPATNVKLVATGRLVPIKVVNKITGKPLAGAQIAVLGTTAKTDKNGKATIALPTKTNSETAKLAAPGYNQASVTIMVTDKSLAANRYALTPSGQIYFLSNLSGTLDVVKSNLDGSGRHVVLAGTGHEDKSSTSLLASRDWKYLVLKSRREGSLAALYLIDTSNDKVTQFDNSDSTFTLVGWYNHNFVYDLNKNSQTYWVAGHEFLKSYDADHQQLSQLDQNQAEGDANSYGYQSFSNFYILNGVVAYNSQWFGGPVTNTSFDLSSKNDTIRAVQPNGQNKKDYQSFPSGTVGYIQASLYEPQAIYYAVPNKAYTSTTYYSFENLTVKTTNAVDQNSFAQGYPTYLLSPSGNQTFWTDVRDGKNTLFIGDEDAKNPKQIASLSAYSPYGWFSDSYTLVSKGGSELYIMPASELSAGQQPLKITDYYKPAQSFSGYGYGYGGL